MTLVRSALTGRGRVDLPGHDHADRPAGGAAVYMDPVLAAARHGCSSRSLRCRCACSVDASAGTSRAAAGGDGRRLNAMLHENVQGNRVVKVFAQEAVRSRAAPRAGRADLPPASCAASRIRAIPITELLAGLAIAASSSGTAASHRHTRTARRAGSLRPFPRWPCLVSSRSRSSCGRTTASSRASPARSARSRCSTVGARRSSTARARRPLDRRFAQGIAFHDVGFAYEPGAAGAAQHRPAHPGRARWSRSSA